MPSSTDLASPAATCPLPAAARTATPAVCYHCHQPVPAGSRWLDTHADGDRHYCCAGCQGMAALVAAAGLDAFYARSRTGGSPARPATDSAAARDAEALAIAARTAGAIVARADGSEEASLLIEGLHCGACVELIERWLARQPGIVDARLNMMTARMQVRWDPATTNLATVLQAVTSLGFRAQPYDRARREAGAQRSDRAALTRAAVAVLAMMQVMMFAVPAYISHDGVAPEYQALLARVSLVLTLPVVVYCAWPLFAGAVRDVRARRLGMDVPVTLGIAIAFAASVHATVTGRGALYYDSVTMFVALLLCARYLETRARRRAGDAIEAIAPALPGTADRLRADGSVACVAASTLAPGEHIRVAAGATIPVDGVVVAGRARVSEAVLTGESWPQPKGPGDAVLAGSLNGTSPLTVEVRRAGERTSLSALARLVDRAAAARPAAAAWASRVAAWFVAGQLAVALAATLWWWPRDAALAVRIGIAVLIVSCPCALALAWPAAIASAVGGLARRGSLVVRDHALDTLARVTTVAFDKTGTLTQGRIALRDVRTTRADIDAPRARAVAAALEAGSDHPLAAALRDAAPDAALQATNLAGVTGCGVEGDVDGRHYRLGKPGWALGACARPATATEVAALADLDDDATIVALADADGLCAAFALADTLRPSAHAMVVQLKAAGLRVVLLSGDREPAVAHVAHALGIDAWRGDCMPDAKCDAIRALQRGGDVVAMVGDGLNDGGALAQADAGIVFGRAAAATQWAADVVLLTPDPAAIAGLLASARRTRRVIRQNLGWALAYNAVAVPLAIAGALTPLVAAVGMSLSSVLVVANALRLLRTRATPAGSA
ncbi:MAG: heavy metal translocating P-type ATPase [Proteobacteria bacterium]|nr:heavy metal translocating P-type ATPase [Pseudomonadota bacterium]